MTARLRSSEVANLAWQGVIRLGGQQDFLLNTTRNGLRRENRTFNRHTLGREQRRSDRELHRLDIRARKIHC